MYIEIWITIYKIYKKNIQYSSIYAHAHTKWILFNNSGEGWVPHHLFGSQLHLMCGHARCGCCELVPQPRCPDCVGVLVLARLWSRHLHKPVTGDCYSWVPSDGAWRKPQPIMVKGYSGPVVCNKLQRLIHLGDIQWRDAYIRLLVFVRSHQPQGTSLDYI